MNEVQQRIDKLVMQYKYKKLPEALSAEMRNYYEANLPAFKPSDKLYSLDGTLICKGFKRIVIGDYGAFIEFSDIHANHKDFIIPEKQRYRLLPKYAANIKYLWYTAKDYSDIKIYKQVRTVSYADYVPGMYYIDPYEVKLKWMKNSLANI